MASRSQTSGLLDPALGLRHTTLPEGLRSFTDQPVFVYDGALHEKFISAAAMPRQDFTPGSL